MPVNQRQIKAFRKTVWNYYEKNKRDLPWRNTTDPYKIFISEVMLQQTQVSRVIQKYYEWIEKFPDFKSLSEAEFIKILKVWSGLGYNRRAKFMHESAQIISNQHNGKIPHDPQVIVKLPGIGKSTAASIITFSYNKPLVFIETNIRRVFIHEFFKTEEKIHDTDILQLVEQTLDKNNPREWYYAMMDYGSFLGKTIPNPNKKSMHYTKQSKFDGSVRQIRGYIVKELTNKKSIALGELYSVFGNTERVEKALRSLTQEGFIMLNGDHLALASS